MKAITPEKGQAGRANDQPVQVVDFDADTELSPDSSKESICYLPTNAGDIIAKAISQALDALEGRFA
ncbi:hypothetical protein OAL62_01720 [bacterium]|nr:hypothetical protein [Akkermansiaceae bacterium]MDC0315090.1 hypothetical protein [bacterium]